MGTKKGIKIHLGRMALSIGPVPKLQFVQIPAELICPRGLDRAEHQHLVLDFFAHAGGSVYRFLCFFRFLWAKEIKKDKGAHLRFSKMCSLARFYYSGNRKRKSTAITAKLFIFLIE